MYQLKAGSRNSSRKLDIIHIVLGVIIVVMAVLAFTNPTENMVLFPLIFFFAALLNIVNAVFIMQGSNHNKKLNTQGLVQLLIGGAVMVVGVISAVSIW